MAGHHAIRSSLITPGDREKWLSTWYDGAFLVPGDPHPADVSYSKPDGVRLRLAARAGRRLTAFGLFGAVLTFEYAWLQTLGAVNCSFHKVNGEYCLLLGVPETVVYVALALPVGIAVVALGLLVPPAWTDRARATPPGRLAFAPSNGTLLALLPVLAVAGGGGLLLFFGDLTPRVELWLVLAAPFIPFLLGTGATLWLGGVIADASEPIAALGVALVVMVGVVTTVAQTLWFKALAAGLARMASTAFRRITQS